MSTFSEKLRILRKNKEWTQAQLADALSVSESTVQKWEVDKNAPPVSEIKRLAEVFALSERPVNDGDSGFDFAQIHLRHFIRGMLRWIPPHIRFTMPV